MLMALGFGTVCSVAFHILTNEPENQKLEVRARYIRLINLIICRYNNIYLCCKFKSVILHLL